MGRHTRSQAPTFKADSHALALFDNQFVAGTKRTIMGDDELERLFGQQMFNELAGTAIEEMRSTGKSFDELFPSDVSD
jgi:hypothetical protein